jgi:hypothetical protein
MKSTEFRAQDSGRGKSTGIPACIYPAFNIDRAGTPVPFFVNFGRDPKTGILRPKT